MPYITFAMHIRPEESCTYVVVQLQYVVVCWLFIDYIDINDMGMMNDDGMTIMMMIRERERDWEIERSFFLSFSLSLSLSLCRFRRFFSLFRPLVRT